MPNTPISHAHTAARHATSHLKQLDLRERAGHPPTEAQIYTVQALIDHVNNALSEAAATAEHENAQRLRNLAHHSPHD